MESTPIWVTVIVSAVSLVGGALVALLGKALNQWVNYKKQEVDLRGAASKVTLEQKRNETDLEIHVTDNTINRWRQIAEDANKRADESDKRTRAIQDDANNAIAAARAEADKRVAAITAWWQEREANATKQHEERELQFTEMIQETRKESDARFDALSHKYEDVVRSNYRLEGRVEQLEKDHAECREDNISIRKELEEVKNRVEAQSTRKQRGRVTMLDPEQHESKEPPPPAQ